MTLTRFAFAIAALSTAVFALLLEAAASPACSDQQAQPAQVAAEAKIDAERVGRQLESLLVVHRRFQSADATARRFTLISEYPRAIRDSQAFLGQFRGSVPRLDGQEVLSGVALSDEPGMAAQLVDLMQLTTQMQMEQEAAEPASSLNRRIEKTLVSHAAKCL